MPLGLDKLPSILIKRRSPEDRKKDVDDITDWIRQGRPSNMDSPTNEFMTIDQMLPTKKNQNPDVRAKDVESVLNWMRTNNIPSVPGYDETEMPLGMEKLPSIPVKRRSPEDRQKDVDDITDWIRQGRPSEIDSPTNEFKTIDQILPTKKNQSPDDRAKDVEGVLNWMRTNNIPSVPTFDENNMPLGLDKLPSIPIKRRSPEDRQK